MIPRRRHHGWIYLLCLLAGLLLATGPWLNSFSLVAQEPEAEEEQEAQETVLTAPLEIPEEEKQRENPFRDDEEVTALGKQLYRSQCAMCHGKEGRGDGDLADEMELAMPDFASDAVQERTDGELFYILSEGHGAMPAQGERMPEKNRWAFVNHVRALGAEDRGSSEPE